MKTFVKEKTEKISLFSGSTTITNWSTKSIWNALKSCEQEKWKFFSLFCTLGLEEGKRAVRVAQANGFEESEKLSEMRVT